MAHVYLESGERFIVGAKPNLGILCWDESNPDNDISSATATLTVYSETGSVQLASGACGITGTTLLSIQRLVDTTGWTPGKYRVDVDVMLGTNVQTFQFGILVDARPGPQ